MNPILVIILLSIAGVIGDVFIKLATESQRLLTSKWFVLGILTYGLTAFGWFYAMKHTKLSVLGVVYSLSTVLLLVLIGVFYFHEKLNVSESIGIAAAILSLILLSRFV